MYFTICPKHGPNSTQDLHRVGILGLFCPKQGQGSNSQRHPYTQTWAKNPPPPGLLLMMWSP